MVKEPSQPANAVDCAKYFLQNYFLTDIDVRMYTVAFLAEDTSQCELEWKRYYLDQGVEEGRSGRSW